MSRMPHVDDLLSRALPVPALAVVLYTDPNQRHDLILATAHRMQASRNGTPVLGAGTPLCDEDEREIVALLQGRRRRDAAPGWLPAGLLAERGDRVLWWRPAEVRAMHLRRGESLDSVMVCWPTLVCMAEGDTFRLAAVLGSDTPTPATPLMHAPLGNVYRDGALCLGTCRPPVETGRDAMVGWNTVVDESAFTHSNHDRFVAGVKDTRDAAGYWLKRARGTRAKEPFTARELVPMGTTLGDWWDAT